MRGRTLNSAFIILDEAQNTSPEQMKMFLTRIGFGSKAVVTGDVTQVDVQGGKSGLGGLEQVLGHVDGIAFTRLSGRDVVRHRIVQDIVDAYDKASANSAGGAVSANSAGGAVSANSAGGAASVSSPDGGRL
jgi:phosphate starvation-inducible PhoH-like protein